MAEASIDLLAIDRGTITAPAGCGKTHLIAETLKRHSGPKPILVLTHTNAGVAALRGRLDSAAVQPRAYRLSTIDGWALRVVGLFPQRAEIDLALLTLANPRNDYPAIRKAAALLLKGGHIHDIVRASYASLIVDEYQDCSVLQHAIACYAALALPTVVLGDPMQAIFGWPGNELADWEKHVCTHFPLVGELTTPWRWKNAGTETFGHWLLEVRRKLIEGKDIDLAVAPPEVTWIHLDGTEDRVRQLRAGLTAAPTAKGSVLIIEKSISPQSQREFASKTPGAVTVEAVDLKDLVEFSRTLDFQNVDALARIADFAGTVMTNVGPADLVRRVGVLSRGTERKAASDTERAALKFLAERTSGAAASLLVEISKDGGVRTHRPAILRACMRALQACDGNTTFHQAAIQAREQNRLLGRPLPRRAVGSTLLLKGLEADVSVIVDAGDLDKKNLYVAMTRGARKLVICSREAVLRR